MKQYPLSIIRINETGSTNTHLMQLLSKEELKPYTILVTDNQTSGRGQQDKTWHASPGMNLTFSILLKNDFLGADKLFLVNKIVALSVVQYLKKIHNISATIKWPNDIFVNFQKISGILIENSIAGNQINCIAGIGMNINQETFPQMSPQAVSLKNITGNSYPLLQCLDDLTNIIIFNVENFIDSKSDDASEIYNQHLLFLGEERQYKIQNQNKIGSIRGVNETGQLIFSESKTQKTFYIDHGQFDYNVFENFEGNT